ncbi:hypothetical protein F5Y19DRAFT_479757 [Xylariaceae sp. FL1651]|nr:hypothetical protein F5Y19DRAFT_479757 [Xylariaceae sp. FL1651]
MAMLTLAYTTDKLHKVMAGGKDLGAGVAPVPSAKNINHVPVEVDDEIDEQEIEEELLPDPGNIIDIVDLTDDKPRMILTLAKCLASSGISRRPLDILNHCIEALSSNKGRIDAGGPIGCAMPLLGEALVIMMSTII